MLCGLRPLKWVCDCSSESACKTRRSRHSTRDSSSSLPGPTHGASTSWPSRAANHPSSQADHWCNSRRRAPLRAAPPSPKSKHQASQALAVSFKTVKARPCSAEQDNQPSTLQDNQPSTFTMQSAKHLPKRASPKKQVPEEFDPRRSRWIRLGGFGRSGVTGKIVDAVG